MLEELKNWILQQSGYNEVVVAVLDNRISIFFTCLIFIYLLTSIALLRKQHRGTLPTTIVANAPSILTSLGILGTFTGIFYGLIEFDLDSINSSIHQLLEGLKVAFCTSILGLGSALFFRISKPFLEKAMPDEGVTAEDLLQALAGIEQRIEASREVTQAGFEAQIMEFKQFAEHMSKAFSDAIIEELKSVIREFNDKMSEQFGENFKQLNEAVGRLLEWQENYRIQLEDLKRSFDTSVESLLETEAAITKVERATRSIPEHAQQLSDANHSLNTQIEKLYEGLSSIEEMRTRAESAIPDIAGRIDAMTNTIGASVEEQRQTVEAVRESISSSLAEQQTTQQQMLEGLQSAFNETLQTAMNHLNDAVKQLDEAMQTEIENTVRTMAESLSGIAQKFVSDYDSLLEQVRLIAELGNKAQRK